MTHEQCIAVRQTVESAVKARPSELTAEQAEQFVLSVIHYIQTHMYPTEVNSSVTRQTADSRVGLQPHAVYPLSAFPHYQEFSDSV